MQFVNLGDSRLAPWRLFSLICLLLLSAATPASAAGPDWLLDSAPYVAKITVSDSAVTLDNGLVRRVIRTQKGSATVAFDNLVTGERMLRSVRPEAIVEIDGTKFSVGGLLGQPIQNYLDPKWLAAMTADPAAYSFKATEVGETLPRFAWKKRLEWMPKDVPWPPPGKHVVLKFVPPAVPGNALKGAVLFEETLGQAKELDRDWKVHTSTANASTTFKHEGKPGEILALTNICVYAERPWPKDAATVEVTVFAGDDKASNSFGPGLALLTHGGPIVFNIRPDNGQLEYFVAGQGHQPGIGKYDRTKPCRLRIRFADGAVNFEAAQGSGEFALIHSSACGLLPTALRVGKLGIHGKGQDYAPFGTDLARSAVQQVTIRGAEPVGALAPRTDLPEVDVHYEIYDGIPLVSKWISVRNTTAKPVRLNTFKSEVLAVMEPESAVEKNPRWESPRLYVETNYAFGTQSAKGGNAVAVNWKTDGNYGTQVNYRFQTPCLLECAPPIGPDQDLKPGDTFTSFHTFELALDSTERERNGLAQRRLYRTVAPWVTENPIMMHVRNADPAAVHKAIDQCADVGFEMVIMSFSSGFNFESRDAAYQATYKELADYARSKHVALGGYSLLSSRGAGTTADNVQGPPRPQFGQAPCLGAKWGQEYLQQIKTFATNAGLEVFENDGSYPGDVCNATNHPGHHGLEDSQWVQWQGITGLYQWCRGQGIFLNVPDWYFLNGSSKIAMGYRETNWSLPRAQQEIIERQNIFDGTWEKTPSMGWMLVPLTEYQGGGAAATIEPLKEHLPHYEQRLANLFGAGVQACYRGPRLYDAPETRDLVKKWVDFYKGHRAILDSDILHLQRADGRDLDYILHVNPALKEKGLLFIYNPLPEKIQRTLTVPLYYTGLTEMAQVREQEGPPQKLSLDRQYKIELPVTVPANGFNWYVIE